MRIIVLLTALCGLAREAQGQDACWKSQVLLECDQGMGGGAIGDLDPDTPGPEVTAVNAAGEVWLVRRTENGWRPQRIYTSTGELIMCAIGDVDPRHRGCEFVGVGMVTGRESSTGPGQVLQIHKHGDEWIGDPVFTDDHMIHGVAVGDVSRHHQGNEIVVCGFSHRVNLLSFDEGRWKHETIYVGNDRMKIAVIADVLSEREGLEVLVCGSDGQVVVLWEGKLGWRHDVIFSDPVGQSRVAAHDCDVLIGGDKGKVTWARRRDSRWLPEFVVRDTGKIRGVAIADIDADHPGVELYSCGYSRRVTKSVWNDQGFWTSEVIFSAERPLHHLLAGEFEPTHAGPELLTCGHGGRLIALYPDS